MNISKKDFICIYLFTSSIQIPIRRCDLKVTKLIDENLKFQGERLLGFLPLSPADESQPARGGVKRMMLGDLGDYKIALNIFSL